MADGLTQHQLSGVMKGSAYINAQGRQAIPKSGRS